MNKYLRIHTIVTILQNDQLNETKRLNMLALWCADTIGTPQYGRMRENNITCFYINHASILSTDISAKQHSTISVEYNEGATFEYN